MSSSNAQETAKQTSSQMQSNQKKAEKPNQPAEGAAQEGGEKSKADLRRERKAIQEAQRAKKAAGGAVPADASKNAKEQKKPENKPPTPKPQSQPAQQTAPKQDDDDSAFQAPSSDASVTKLTTNLKSSLKISSTSTGTESQKEIQFETSSVTLKLTKKKPDSNEDLSASYKSRLFHHFDQYKRDYSITEKLGMDNTSIHPSFIRLGIQSAHDCISGSNARCIAFLKTFKQFINDYKAPNRETKTISKDLESKLKPNINFLTQCRPLSISMANAIKEMKQVISHFPLDMSETEAKRTLNDEIDRFIDEKILLAGETICKYILANNDIVISGTSYAKSKITNDDNILIYGYSSLITQVLLEARRKFPKMHVIVVDSRPKLKGKSILEHLIKHDINCTYISINGISFVMNRVSKVLLGAHALLANGYVMSAIGSSQIALVAKSFNVPVVVCCETYKFCDKVQTDALVNNELGNPLDLLKYSNRFLENEKTALSDWSSDNREYENLSILNLTYDVTPPDLISCVVTDMGMLPCTSVPVVLRVKNRDNYRKANNSEESNTN